MIKNIYKKLFIGLIALGALFTVAHPLVTQGTTVPLTPALFDTILQSGISASDTTLTLGSGTLRDGTTLTGYACFTIDEGTASVEYVCGTASSTAVTAITRGIDPLTGTTTVASLQFAHRRGADIKITNYPALTIVARIINGLDAFVNTIRYASNVTISSSTDITHKGYVDTAVASTTSYLNSGFFKNSSNNTVTGANSFTTAVNTFTLSPVVPSPSGNTDAANKGYVDGVAIAGAPLATNLTTGIGRVASTTQIASGFASTTAYSIPSSLASSTASTTASIVVATKSATGKIDPSFLNGSNEAYTFNGTTTLGTSTLIATYPIYGDFGDGRDGDVTISGGATTTLSRDMYYNNLTVTGGLVTSNYRVFVKGTLSGAGIIAQDGVAGGVAGNSGCGGGDEGGAAGSNGTAITGYFNTFAAPVSGRGGFSGNTGSNGVSATTSIGVSGSNSASGQTGGVSSTSTVFGILSWQTLAGLDISASGATAKVMSGSSSASPSGGGNNGGTGCEGAGSGGTGSGGGLVWIVANNWNGSFIIRAVGGAGGAGGNSSNSGTGIGNGGSGGPGGTAVIIYRNKAWTGTYALNGGALGAAGTGSANAGTAGIVGVAGVSYEIPLFRLLK